MPYDSAEPPLRPLAAPLDDEDIAVHADALPLGVNDALAYDRTYLAYERTFAAWLRTPSPPW